MKGRLKENIRLIISALCLGAFIVSCSKSDDFKKYTDSGEIIYSGKLDSVKILPGNARVKLRALLPADPKVTKAKVYWNNGKDSIIAPIDRSTGSKYFETIIPTAEGIQSFVIYTYDEQGNKSVPVNAVGKAYGSRYNSGLINRPLDKAVAGSTSTSVNWLSIDTSASPLFTEVKYTSATGEKVIKVSVKTDVTTISDLASSAKTFSYRTAYLPPSSIDTFYTDYKVVGVFRDVTSTYLRNTGPFTTATLDGRWGTLGAPWITNAAAKNKGGVNGGYTADDGGAINWETWFNTPVTNGIIYQPSAVPLPEGNYFVQFDQYSEIQSNSSVFCIVAPGGNGIPTLDNLNTALGSLALYNGAAPGTTGPSINNTVSFGFKVTSPQVVSLGFLGNLGSSPSVGNYFRVKNIRLYSDN